MGLSRIINDKVLCNQIVKILSVAEMGLYLYGLLYFPISISVVDMLCFSLILKVVRPKDEWLL